jgi:hypothetical protein
MNRLSSFRNILTVLAALALGGTGCAPREGKPDAPDSTRIPTSGEPSDLPTVAPAETSATPAPVALPPLADTIAQRLVFPPVMQNWFTAAVRGKRLLVDLGRIDIDLKKDASRLAAFVHAAEARSPVPKGTRLRLRGPWGADDATLSGFDVHNGRIVGTLELDPRIDSLAASTDPLIASAERVATPAASVTSTCDRTLGDTLRDRLTSLADSVERVMRAGDQPIYPRLQKALRARQSFVPGCFGEGRAIVIVTLWAGDYEWVRERVLLVGDAAVKPLTVRDLRFRGHEALQALDANDDGVDDLAARAWTPRGGGTVILTLVDGARLERLASGFAYER